MKVPESLRRLHGDIVSEVLLSMSKCIELEKLLQVHVYITLENESTLWLNSIESIL
jgi:hypothetical protein